MLDKILHNKLVTVIALCATLGGLCYVYGLVSDPRLKDQLMLIIGGAGLVLMGLLRSLNHKESSEGMTKSDVKDAVATIAADVVIAKIKEPETAKSDVEKVIEQSEKAGKLLVVFLVLGFFITACSFFTPKNVKAIGDMACVAEHAFLDDDTLNTLCGLLSAEAKAEGQKVKAGAQKMAASRAGLCAPITPISDAGTDAGDASKDASK